jgi:crotonobetainyl-CoA:carnitine CoA-transferase CaiB-like acyl-CoA transferase
VLNQAVKLSRTGASIASATPEVGQHTDEILRELGYSDGDIRAMRERRVV